MTAVRGFFGHLGFVWNRNLWRLLLVLVVLTALIASSGTVAFLQSVFGIIAQRPGVRAPAVVRRLLPDHPIRVPVLVPVAAAQVHGHARTTHRSACRSRTTAGSQTCSSTRRSTVGILRGVKEFELRGGEMPRGMLLSGAPGTGKTFLAAVIAAEAELPFIYIDASSHPRHVLGHDRDDDHEALPGRPRARPEVRPSMVSAAPASCSWTRSIPSA